MINQNNPLSKKIVSDIEYDLKYNPLKNSWEMSNKMPICNSQTKVDNFIVVLESPHIKEFIKNEALCNDKYFKLKFPQLLENSDNLKIGLNKKVSYKVYIINAIKYQCSLGLPTQYYRDYVFLYYWRNLEKDFKKKVSNLISNNTIGIINLCTKGSHSKTQSLYNKRSGKHDDMGRACNFKFITKIYGKVNPEVKSLQDLVGITLKKFIKNNIKYTVGTHPSSWCSNHANIK